MTHRINMFFHIALISWKHCRKMAENRRQFSVRFSGARNNRALRSILWIHLTATRFACFAQHAFILYVTSGPIRCERVFKGTPIIFLHSALGSNKFDRQTLRTKVMMWYDRHLVDWNMMTTRWTSCFSWETLPQHPLPSSLGDRRSRLLSSAGFYPANSSTLNSQGRQKKCAEVYTIVEILLFLGNKQMLWRFLNIRSQSCSQHNTTLPTFS